MWCVVEDIQAVPISVWLFVDWEYLLLFPGHLWLLLVPAV